MKRNANWPGQRRAVAEYLGGTRIRYRWECGASQVKDHGKGKVSQRMGAAACEMMARRWTKEAGGVTVPCPRGPGCPDHAAYQESLRQRWWYSRAAEHAAMAVRADVRWACKCGACVEARKAHFKPT